MTSRFDHIRTLGWHKIELRQYQLLGVDIGSFKFDQRTGAEHIQNIKLHQLNHFAFDPQAYAQALYAQLRALDQVGADLILVEQPPKTTAWQGINDRLQRAAFDSVGVLERLLA